MEVQTVDKLSEIVRVTNEWSDNRGLYCYRGQSDERWGLVPTVFRHLAQKYDELHRPIINNDDVSAATDVEIRIYEQFRERARAYKHDRVNLDNPWEMLCLAQHFGVPSRLLDWTSNPLVAAFFAVADLDDQKNGVIWCFNIPRFLREKENRHLVVGGQSFDTLPNPRNKEQGHITFLRASWLRNLPRVPRLKKEIILIQPPDIDDRMKIQSSFFTIYVSIGQTKEDDFVWSHSLWLEENERDILRKLIIPRNCKHDFLIQLGRMGITYNSLFPGLAALGEHLTALQKEWLRSP